MVKKVSEKHQERWVVSAAVGIVVASIVTTLWVSGFFQSGAPQSGYKNVTFTDALLTCREQTHAKFSGQLQSLTTDDHSSRFSQPDRQYKIFFTASMPGDRDDPKPINYYIGCYVSADRGTVDSYDAHEEKELKTQAIRKNSGGLFGWPLNKD